MHSKAIGLALLSIFVFANGCASRPKPAIVVNLEANQDSVSSDEPKSPIGKLKIANGTVQVKAAGTGALRAAQNGETLHLKESIITGPESSAKVVMDDTNELDLASNSQIEVKTYEIGATGKRQALLNLLNGQVRAKVRQKYDGGKSQFLIKTPTAVAGVRGTDFLALFDPINTRSEIVTFDGAVEFGQASALGTIINSVSVKAGESSVALTGESPSAPTSLSKEQLAKLDNASNVVVVTEYKPPAETPVPKPTPQATHESHKGVDPKTALVWLQHGNDRFLKRHLRNDGQGKKDIQRLSTGQHPHAIVLSCSDSRVPPEIVFDQKLGEIFVVRTAGEALDENVIASIEYAIEHLGARLLIVMGHTACGAVKAAISTLDGKDAGSPALNHLVKDIQPRIQPMISRNGASKDLAKESLVNARGVAASLQERSEIIREAVEKGEVLIQPALYDIGSGKVLFD